MQVYINRVLRGELSYAEHTTTATQPGRRRLHAAGAGARFLVGFADDVDAASAPPLYGDFIVDEVELWFQDRDTLLAFGYIDRGILYGGRLAGASFQRRISKLLDTLADPAHHVGTGQASCCESGSRDEAG